ncbi:hypothetical protein [Curtobacterium sp. MCBD17_008]|uniref:hypothetical protein n=1 Tax=Curtobacterium sp. MCBD17_008 TaxID=2175656 RepID=UPI000DA78E48|nr:hypothetical protein [Curtobacterium sp. MCBD17_008]PZE91645.1 hypothetical protein DEI95_09695 [Curtobacterium sp. MCBD17_008]
MTEERPDDAREPDGPVTPDSGDDGREARRAPAPDAPFSGLRSAADIFGAPLTEEEWPSRRERREAERAARQAGRPEPEPFTAPASAPVAPASAPAPELDPGATQAISMPEELALPGGVAGRVPPPAAVPPVSNAPDPRAIVLPTARSDREARAAEARAIEDERRRTDPDGLGRSDVDWLGRVRPGAVPSADPSSSPGVTPVPPALAGGPDAQPLGVEDVLPATDEPPTFTELLRLHDDVDGAPQADRPFDWSVLGEETGEVQTTLTQDAFDTNLVAAGSWATGATVPDAASHADPDPIDPDPVDDDRAGERTTPSGGSSWSLSDEAARTGEVFPGDVTDDDSTMAMPLDRNGVDDHGAGSRDGGHDDGDLDDDLDDSAGTAPTAAFAPRSAAPAVPPSVLPSVVPPSSATPWWEAEEDESPRVVPADHVPPLVEPGPHTARRAPEPRTPSDDRVAGADGTTGSDRVHDRDPAPERDGAPWRLAPEDIDQSEWQGRETSDTGVIKDLFGTEAIQQLRDADAARAEDTSTRMMPAVAATPPSGQAESRTTDADRANFINEGFARLQSEGRRGKQLLVYGSVAIIVVLLLLVLVITAWIRGNSLEEQPASPSSSPAGALAVHPPTSALD